MALLYLRFALVVVAVRALVHLPQILHQAAALPFKFVVVVAELSFALLLSRLFRVVSEQRR